MSKLKHLVKAYGSARLADLIASKMVPRETRVVSYELRANVAKSGFFKPEYSFDVPISTTTVDSDGQRMSEDFLKSIPNRYDSIDGYYEEEHPEGFKRNYNPDFRMDSIRYDDGRLVGTVHILKDSPRYNEVVKSLRSGEPRGVSIELNRAVVTADESTILDAEGVNGFIITRTPANKDTYTKIRV